MVKVVDEGPDPSVVKRTVCQSCGAVLEYVPRDIITLWSGTDMGGGSDVGLGFLCPKCDARVVVERL